MYEMDMLKQLRKEKGITGSKIAKALQITPAFYSQIENKKKRLYYDNAVKIAKIFHMKPDELFYPTKNKNM